jgi:type IV pilus assembly protein PilN
MVRINLLPHRAEKRRIRQMQFFALVGVSLFLALTVVGFGSWVLSSQIDYQNSRNGYLKEETVKLEKQIEEIQKLRGEINDLLKRKTVVDDLQNARFDVVHLLDQMLRILPEGVYLKSLKQTGDKITIVGHTQSNARVSTLMAAIEASPWLAKAELVEIHAIGTEGNRDNEFTLTFNLTREDAPGKPIKKKGGA